MSNQEFMIPTGRLIFSEPNIQDINPFNERLGELSPEVRKFILILLEEELVGKDSR